jgi:hypothetical protein
MNRKFIITVFAFLTAVPAFSHTRQTGTVPTRPALHLMNDGEFTTFLKRLDSDLLRSQLQLKNMDVRSLRLDEQQGEEMEGNYNRCLESLDNVREEIQKLTQKQTLKLDLFLLIDLNELARGLDVLDQGLVNPGGDSGGSAAQKSLGYGRDVLNMDASLARHITEFQHHFLAFTGVIDATLSQPDQDPAQPQTEK